VADIKLGDSVVDSVSGFKGIVIGQTQYLHGYTQFGIQPKVDIDGKLPDVRWFDERRVLKLESEPFVGMDAEEYARRFTGKEAKIPID
jgi:hypothetical protein